MDVICPSYKVFPPGHYLLYSPKSGGSTGLTKYFHPQWMDETYVPPSLSPSGDDDDVVEKVDYVALRTGLEDAVRKRLMSDVPYGVLLSGQFSTIVTYFHC